MSKDYYNILGVNRDASDDELKKAFRKKAHEYHPDKGGGDEAKFKEVNEAYQVLRDKEKRAQYDRFGSAPFQGGASGSGGFTWTDFGGNPFGGFGGQVHVEDIGDIFGEFFGMGGRSSRAERASGAVRGNDIELEMVITLPESAFGAEKKVSYSAVTVCEHCSGNGAEPGTAISSCPQCHGSGSIEEARSVLFGSFMTRSVCPTCRGSGKKPDKFCRVCHGAGRRTAERAINVKVPAGINEGESIRLSGAGEAGMRGGSSGDLYIHFKIKPDASFTRVGDDLISRASISFPQAALGDIIKVETLDGAVDLKIPSGTVSGTRLALRGKGITRLRGSGRGDQLVEITVKVPTHISRKARKLLEELRDEI